MIVEAEKGGARVLCGGSAKCDPANKYIAPTVLANAPKGSRVMTEEIFGPILVIREVDDMSQAITMVNEMEGTPLALYVFTANKAVCDRLLDACPSGGALRNDVLLHFAGCVPFGGLGTSGYGNAHSDWSWRTFTHERAFMYKPCHPAFEFGDIRYAPVSRRGHVRPRPTRPTPPAPANPHQRQSHPRHHLIPVREVQWQLWQGLHHPDQTATGHPGAQHATHLDRHRHAGGRLRNGGVRTGGRAGESQKRRESNYTNAQAGRQTGAATSLGCAQLVPRNMSRSPTHYLPAMPW